MQTDMLTHERREAGPPDSPCAPLDEIESVKVALPLRLVQRIAAVEKFAGGVAHDFNNILTVIVGHAQILLEHPEIGPSARRRVQQILDAAFRAASLTGQILAISHKKIPQPTVLNLNRVVDASSSMIRFLTGEKIELKTLLAADLCDVNADPCQMEQVLINFCLNARDAMPEGGLVLIETRNLEVTSANSPHHSALKPGCYVQLSVSDTGSGMDEQTASRIFEPFFTTKTPDKAVGLGLAIVHRIVRQSGGQLRVVSEPGQGSTFSVYLPVAAEAAQQEKREQKLRPVARGLETILVVSGAGPLRGLVREILEGFGYDVLDAEDSTGAQRLAAHHQGISALVLDMALPALSGTDLVSSLRTFHPELKLLQMAAPPSGFVNYGFHGAGTDFIRKPFSGEALAQKLRNLLDRSE